MGGTTKWCPAALDLHLQERKEKRRKTGEEPSDSDSEDMEELLGRFSNVQQAGRGAGLGGVSVGTI